MRFPRFNNLFFLTLVIFISCSVFAQGQPPDDEITVDSSIVILNAFVSDPHRRSGSGYSVSDFELLEDGVRQTIDFVEPESTPFSAVILLDVSGSMEQRVSIARAAAIRFLQGIRPEDQVAIFSFDRKVELVQEFSNSKDLRSKFFDLEASGYTSLYDAVRNASDALQKRSEKRKAIIVLSDGADTSSGISASKALKAAQDADATLYTVDMSVMESSMTKRRQNQQVLKNFANKTGGVFVATPGGVQLRKAFEDIVEDLSTQYTIGYHSTNQKNDGKWRRIELKSTREKVSIRAREGYYASSGESK